VRCSRIIREGIVMAKIISGIGEDIKYAPGVIYDLGALGNGIRVPFYVGETSNADKRLAEHRRAGRDANDDSTKVYQTIKDLDNAGIEWDMKVLAEYGEEGPTDLEDEWIMNHLYAKIKLRNMKKGNANWEAERVAAAADMRKRKITSYRQYKKIITQEELDKKHAEWIREQEILDLREQNCKKMMAEVAAAQAVKIAKMEEEKKLKEQKRLEAQARWIADAPYREARLREETEQLIQREQMSRDRKIEYMYAQRKAAAGSVEHHANLFKSGLFEEAKK